MTTRHTAITDAEKHEPKGAADAAAWEVYRADGAGSGSWGKPFKLIGSETTSSSPTTDTYIEFTGLDGYDELYLVCAILEAPTSQELYLQIDNSGTYTTSGYHGWVNDNLNNVAEDTDNFSSGIVISKNRNSGRLYTKGVWRIYGLNGGQPTLEGKSMTVDNNFLSSASGASNFSYQRCFGRYPGTRTVTKLRLGLDASSFAAGDVRSVFLYGVR